MLRLPPTTLSLTITEVKDFERHLRFKKYLAKDDTFGQLAIRTKKDSTATQKSTESERDDADQANSETTPKDPKDYSINEVEESPRLLSYPPRRPPKSGGGSAESGSLNLAHTSPSGTPSSLNTPQPTGWGNLPMTLPPPFSREKRNVSDAQSLPSTHQSIQGQANRGDAGQEPPVTPPRRSSLRVAHTEIHSSSPPVRGRRRFVSSAVRFVESMIPSPRRGSTSPSPSSSTHASRPDSDSSVRETELGFRIYNDALSASSQPQTPRNLPEARHRSRLYGSYTAPHHCLTSASSHRSSIDRTMRDTTGSPSGLETPGFQGLYGGRENSEDSALFHEASRYRDEGFGEEEQG
ncbi:hypothetical protein F4805DRAFT_95389 [Annulohypoxylon moriforme]|nr:hypothetical protein F4805DRAFT_95389 [Annulohypoxylon moriforme]